MWLAALLWYELTPDVAMMGQFNLQYLREFALIFLVSVGALAWGGGASHASSTGYQPDA